MSDLLTSHPGDSEGDPRRRAIWGLIVLALVAAVVAAFMLFFLGTSDHHRNDAVVGLGSTSKPAEPSGSKSHPSSRAPTSPKRATSARPKPTSTANPCPAAVPCAVAGDSGHAVAALNDFRVRHGLRPVPGAVSPQAQLCALQEGSGPSCEPHYSWEPVPTQDGPGVISKITGGSGGTQWLLDAAMSSFSVGWAYAPGAGGGPGLYECAILKTG